MHLSSSKCLCVDDEIYSASFAFFAFLPSAAYNLVRGESFFLQTAQSPVPRFLLKTQKNKNNNSKKGIKVSEKNGNRIGTK